MPSTKEPKTYQAQRKPFMDDLGKIQRIAQKGESKTTGPSIFRKNECLGMGGSWFSDVWARCGGYQKSFMTLSSYLIFRELY